MFSFFFEQSFFFSLFFILVSQKLVAVFQRSLKIRVTDQSFAIFQIGPLKLPMFVGESNWRLGIGQFRQPIDDAFGIAVGDVVEFFDESVDHQQIGRC